MIQTTDETPPPTSSLGSGSLFASDESRRARARWALDVHRAATLREAADRLASEHARAADALRSWADEIS